MQRREPDKSNSNQVVSSLLYAFIYGYVLLLIKLFTQGVLLDLFYYIFSIFRPYLVNPDIYTISIFGLHK